MFKKLLAFFAAMTVAVAFAAVDVNKATSAELDGIKGIGPSISGKIIDERKKGNFKSWEDFIERVKGIGEGNAAKFSAEGLTIGGAGYKGAAAAPVKTDAKPAGAAAAPAAAKADAKPASTAAAPAKADVKPAAPAAVTAAAPAVAKDDKKDAKVVASAKKDDAKAKPDAKADAAKPAASAAKK